MLQNLLTAAVAMVALRVQRSPHFEKQTTICFSRLPLMYVLATPLLSTGVGVPVHN